MRERHPRWIAPQDGEDSDIEVMGDQDDEVADPDFDISALLPDNDEDGYQQSSPRSRGSKG